MNKSYTLPAVGEPPIGLAVGALFANKLAIRSARKDLNGSDDFLPTGQWVLLNSRDV